MDDTRTLNHIDFERHLRLRRRVKRGLVASYIHELSGRRNGNGAAPHAGDGEKDLIDLADAKGD